jgi:hypothetical protein
MSREPHLTRAKEEIFDAVRFLAPDEAERVLREMAEAMKRLAEKYDHLLADAILS